MGKHVASKAMPIDGTAEACPPGTREELAKLRKDLAEALAREAVLRKAFACDHSWSLRSVLLKLQEAATILLDVRDHDGHGWEQIHAARGEVGWFVEAIDHAFSEANGAEPLKAIHRAIQALRTSDFIAFSVTDDLVYIFGEMAADDTMTSTIGQRLREALAREEALREALRARLVAEEHESECLACAEGSSCEEAEPLWEEAGRTTCAALASSGDASPQEKP